MNAIDATSETKITAPSTPLRVLIVDDEAFARMRLRGLVQECESPKAQVVAELVNASEAQHWLGSNSCDVVLLDVQMPGPDGLMLVESLRGTAQETAIVFVTAHAAHAVRAFDLDAVDYLTKPVRRERLVASLERVARRLHERRAAQGAAQSSELLEGEGVMVVSDRGRVHRIPIGEVLYFKAELKYLTLRTARQNLVMVGSLLELEQRLGERFLRVHRNALVNRAAVRELERRMLPAEGGAVADDAAESSWAVRVALVDEWLAVSRRQVSAVREALLRLEVR